MLVAVERFFIIWKVAKFHSRRALVGTLSQASNGTVAVSAAGAMTDGIGSVLKGIGCWEAGGG
jgi:hypothetical protein